MTNDELRDAINSIIKCADGETSARIEQVIGYDWCWNLFSRAVLLAGTAPYDYVEVDFRDDNGPTGSIVIITSNSIVRIGFVNPVRDGGQWSHDLMAESIPRTAIRRATIEQVAGATRSDVAWPLSAQVVFDLDRTLGVQKHLTLTAWAERAVELALVAQSAW